MHFVFRTAQVQFLIVFVHTIQIQFQPSCAFPKQIGALLSLNAGIFTYMFSSFYIYSYTRKPRAVKEKENNNNDTGHVNKNCAVDVKSAVPAGNQPVASLADKKSM